MKTILWILLIVEWSVTAQSLYYQRKGLLTIDGKEFSFLSGNDTVKLFNGIISSNGKFAAGFRLSSLPDGYVKSYEENALINIVSYMHPELIVVSLETNSIIFSRQSNIFPRFDFLSNNQYFYIEFHPDSIQILNLINNSSFQNKIEKKEKILLSGGWLYSTSTSADKLYINKFSFTLNRFERIDTLYDRGQFDWHNLQSIHIRQGEYFIAAGDSIIRLFLSGKNQWKNLGEFYRPIHVYNMLNRFIVYGKMADSLVPGLYAFREDHDDLEIMFSWFELQTYKEDLLSSVSIVIPFQDEYIFLLKSLGNEKTNLFRYIPKNKELTYFTENGFIGIPIGIINK